IAPLLIGASYARLQPAGQSLEHGHYAQAKSQALSSLSLSAKRPEAYAIVGVVDLREGFAQAAVPAMVKAVSYEPEGWEYQYLLALARAGAGADPRPALRRALVLNPPEPLLRHALLLLGPEDPRRWERLAPALLQAALASGKLSITSL
ncbi:MAG TPA: hypothetical protein VGX16_05435, partial [Solirubrobacteraceae bacterium]|nr:hypothetical protein [Solirubrobacteraceae bacterium]